MNMMDSWASTLDLSVNNQGLWESSLGWSVNSPDYLANTLEIWHLMIELTCKLEMQLHHRMLDLTMDFDHLCLETIQD